MDGIGRPERVTQNRVAALFHDELGYRHLGDWTDREGNSNIEDSLATAYLSGRGYSPEQISRAIYLLRTEANNHVRGLHLVEDLRRSSEWSDKKLRTIEELEYALGIIEPLFGDYALKQITSDAYRAFYDALVASDTETPTATSFLRIVGHPASAPLSSKQFGMIHSCAKDESPGLLMAMSRCGFIEPTATALPLIADLPWRSRLKTPSGAFGVTL